MIELRGLSKNFGRIEAVKGVSLSIADGRITGLIGPNGCGKTTLIKCLLGLVVPDEGELLIGGESIRHDYSYRSRIGYMPQNPDFPENLSIGELLTMLEDIRSQAAPRKDELLESFALGQSMHRRFGELSGGNKQKVAAVAALMFDSPILILDEPTVGLDPVMAAKLKHVILADAQRGKAVLLVTHILSELEQLAHDMIFMLNGQTRYQGTLAELRNRGTGHRDLESAVVAMSGDR